jgi:O-acetyl-ADP-ribose deacetylase (regulator of RNase III)
VGAVLADEEVRAATAWERDSHLLDPVRGSLRHPLLEEEVAPRAVREALHRGGPVAEVTEAGVGNLQVVVEEVELGVPALGEEQLARVREANLAALELEHDVVALGDVREDMAVADLEVTEADVTRLEVDAIANAANTQLRHGGGVAAAISRAGGPEVQRESLERAPIGLGEAVETTAGDMPARYVIHAATMELGGPTSAEIIDRATRSTLRRAEELGLRSVALVAFGTGVGGFPLDEAARLMTAAAREHPGELERIVFCVRGDDARRAFEAALAAE